MRKQIQIKELNLLKEGVSNGRGWKLYNLIDENSDKYTIFGSAMIDGMAGGKTFDIDFKVEERGGFTNRTITKVYLPNPNPSSTPENSVESQIGLLTNRMAKVEIEIQRLKEGKVQMDF